MVRGDGLPEKGETRMRCFARIRYMLAVGIVLLAGSREAKAQGAADRREQIRLAVEKALPQLRKGSEGHMSARSCFACHNQTHVLIAAAAAEKHLGLKVDRGFVESNAKHTRSFLARNLAAYQKGNGQGGQADTAGYALWLLDIAKSPPDEVSSAVSEYLIQYHADWGYWRTSGSRPPSEASHFSTTYAAIRGLKAFATEEQFPRVKERISKAKTWLEKTSATDTEDTVFRLRGLIASESDDATIEEATKQLWALQREDGGWAQTKEMESDAYATGSAMAALADCDPKATASETYQKGVDYLLRTQLENGTWRVTTRSKPFQEYFETGFPHEKDQFISSAATGWAVAALAMGVSSSTP